MKTKEEILDTYCEIHGTFLHLQENNNIIDGDADAVFEAMDENAKEVSIAFLDWIYQHKHHVNLDLYSHDKLFAQFLSEQQSIKQ